MTLQPVRSTQKSFLLSFILGAAWLGHSLPATSAQAAVTTIMLSNQSAPGINETGLLFSGIDGGVRAQITADGRVGFFGRTIVGTGNTPNTASNSGLWLQDNTKTLQAIVRTGTTPVGFEGLGVTWNGVGSGGNQGGWTLASDGKAEFAGSTTESPGFVTATSNEGIWYYNGSSIQLLDREGTTNTAAPAFVWSGFNAKPNMAAGGHLAFMDFLSSAASSGLFYHAAGGPTQIVALQGNVAPGTGGNTYAAFGPLTRIVVNEQGKVAFQANLTTSTLSGFWTGLYNNVSPIALQGQPAPGADGSLTTNLWDSFAPQKLNELDINKSGNVAFIGFLANGAGVTSSTNTGIWTQGSSGTLKMIAREGSTTGVPSLGSTTFRELFSVVSDYPLLSDSGKTVFFGAISGATNNSALFSHTESGGLELLAQAFTQAPGLPAGVNLGPLSNSSNIAVTPSGKIAFYHPVLQGLGVDATNNAALYYQDTLGALQLAARTGDLFAVAPGDLRTISSINFLGGSGGGDGRGTGFTDAGLTFALTFSNGTSGVFAILNPVPEPASATLFAIGLALLARRRRSKN